MNIFSPDWDQLRANNFGSLLVFLASLNFHTTTRKLICYLEKDHHWVENPM